MGDNYRTTSRDVLAAFKLLLQESATRTVFDALDLSEPAKVKAFARRYLGFDDVMAEVFAEGQGDTGSSTHAEALRAGLSLIDTYLNQAAAAVGTCRPPYPDASSQRTHANPPALAQSSWTTNSDGIGEALKSALESGSQYATALQTLEAAAAAAGEADQADLSWLAETLVKSIRP